jgi:hypothetical protein
LTHLAAKKLLEEADRVVTRELDMRDKAARVRALDGPDSDQGGAYRALLLQEHAHMAESLRRNEEDGERRATFFVTFAAGVVAVLGLILGEPQPGDGFTIQGARPLIISTLAVVAAMGLLTLRRVVARNAASDRYKDALHRIRRTVVEGPDDPRTAFLAFNPFEPLKRPDPGPTSLGRGGWLETVALVDAIVVGAMGAVVASTWGWQWGTAAGIAATVVAWIAIIRLAVRWVRAEHR